MFEKKYGNDQVEIMGHWSMVVKGPDGEVKQTKSGKNVVVTNGLEYLASFMSSAACAAATFTQRYIAVGTDSTAGAVSNTALGTEVGRHTGTVSYTSGALYEVVATFAAGSATGAIVEYGLLSANSGGTLFSRDIESVINVGASDTLEVTTKVTVG
tara:strand:- start:3048 stop:3515 length:468 start_codon:yes stop_codon:yes gene_type:complete